MAYSFKFTESTQERASEFETKGLLYLFGIDKDKTLIHLAFVDCFNDITGCDEQYQNLWDLQSKGLSKLPPQKIGVSLITLFFNFKADFGFKKYALFTPPVAESYLVDPEPVEFNFKNFTLSSQIKIQEGLESEFKRRSGIKSLSSEDKEKIVYFLNIATFIVDKYGKDHYVKTMVRFKDRDLKTEEFYREIFNEIRAVQSSKKLININGEKIVAIGDTLKFKKHLRSKDVVMLVINRLVGVDLFKHKSLPIDFLPEVKDLDHETIKDIIQECKSQITRAVFDKNNKEDFWEFLENAVLALLYNPKSSVTDILSYVTTDGKFLKGYFSGYTGFYFISLLKEGLQDDHS